MSNKIKILAVVLAIIVLIAGAFLIKNLLNKNDEINPPKVDESQNPATDFTVYDTNGNPIKLSDLKGKPVVVNFWKSWCVYCKLEMPDFNEMYLKYGDKVHFLFVNPLGDDTVTNAQNYLSNNDLNLPVYYDEQRSATTAYRIVGVPRTLFVNSDGSLYIDKLGAISAVALEAYIGQMLEK